MCILQAKACCCDLACVVIQPAPVSPRDTQKSFNYNDQDSDNECDADNTHSGRKVTVVRVALAYTHVICMQSNRSNFRLASVTACSRSNGSEYVDSCRTAENSGKTAAGKQRAGMIKKASGGLHTQLSCVEGGGHMHSHHQYTRRRAPEA